MHFSTCCVPPSLSAGGDFISNRDITGNIRRFYALQEIFRSSDHPFPNLKLPVYCILFSGRANSPTDCWRFFLFDVSKVDCHIPCMKYFINEDEYFNSGQFRCVFCCGERRTAERPFIQHES